MQIMQKRVLKILNISYNIQYIILNVDIKYMDNIARPNLSIKYLYTNKNMNLFYFTNIYLIQIERLYIYTIYYIL